MADWLNYVGAVTGIVGAVTGIFGAAMGLVANRRVGEMKALDLRIEIQKIESDTNAVLRDLPALIDRATKSRERVNSARGRALAASDWRSTCQADRECVEALVKALLQPQLVEQNHAALERRLAGDRNIERTSGAIRDKYLGFLAEDDRQRDHIRADLRSNPPKL